jgi:hypothetical protein
MSLDTKAGWHAYYWRKLMEHFVFDLHHPILTDDLADDSPYVAAGPLFYVPPEGDYWAHFAGAALRTYSPRCMWLLQVVCGFLA